MDNVDDSENTAKVSDSAYSNSCSNSQCRRSHSSKSTHSGSHSSGSSGYGGKPSTSGSSKTLNQQPEKITKDKEGKKKKKKQALTELAQIQTDVEFRLPDPAPITEHEGELQNVSPPPVRDQTQKVQRSLEVVQEATDEKPDNCNASVVNQSSMQIVMTRPSYSEGFSCVISMHDGVVLYMSPTLTATLGFPKDIWIGRSFIDFVHPLDHNTFASQITSGLVVPKAVNGMLDTGNSVSTIFCRIRRYRTLAAGFNVKERTLSFMPFMLKLTFKTIYEEKGAVIYLVIQATPVFSAFKTPNEVTENAMPFVMRHVADGNVEYIDDEAVPILGYLPQDITNKDVLKLYHPEDLPYLRHVYETVVKYGRVPRSKPYRLMAQNGDYLKFETEWSSFINPWSRKLEFVIGKHYVTEGPANPDVFLSPPTPKTTKVHEEDNIEIEGLRASIVRILNEVSTRPADLVKQEMSKRCQDLASFMERLIDVQPKVDDELRLEIQENDNSYYERDSVMLGGISPHHDYGNDSKSSSETLLSYNQLNYNINLKRYFDSHQETLVEDSANIAGTTMVALKQHISTGDLMSPIAQCSADSLEMTSVESPCATSVVEGPVAVPHDYHSVKLTESIMTKHNSEMEKIFVKRHRESRPTKKEEREKLTNETKQKKKDHLVRCNASYVPTTCSVIAEPTPHGLKRASMHAEAEPSHKQLCVSSRQIRRRQPSSSTTPQPSDSTPAANWPQNFVNGMTPFMPQQVPLITPITTVSGFVPMYYMPTAGTAIPCTSETSVNDSSKNPAQVQLQAPAVQYMMYGQGVFGSPIMVSPINHQATSPRQPAAMQNPLVSAQSNIALTTSTYEEACKPGLSLKASSAAQLAAWCEESRADAAASTRGGARSGTNICSAMNALNRSKEAVPESSAMQDSKMKSEETVDRTDGESSYSSFYSSFFKTESGSAEESGDAKNKRNNPNSSGAPTIPENDNLRNKQLQRRKKEPPWMEQVCVTSELIYKYQVVTKSLDEVLLSDRKKLAEQPSLVNEQLGQLYMDLQLEGVAARLTLEEGTTSSGSSSDDGNKLAIDTLAKRARRKRKYSKLVMIYEEEAPLPSPEQDPEPEPSTSVA